MTKLSIITALIFFIIGLYANLASACDCISVKSVEASLYTGSIPYLFRGFVQREIVINNTDDFAPKQYLVSVRRVYKGCTFTNSTRVIVQTAADPYMCGVTIIPKKSYIFSGYGDTPEPKVISAAIKTNPHVFKKEMVHVSFCDLNDEVKFVPIAEKTLLSKTFPVCKSCSSAADCPGGIGGGEYFCDNSRCVAYTKQCPPVSDDFKRLQSDCVDDPCLRNTMCPGAKRITNKCNMCDEPLWIDTIGNRVSC